MQAAGNGSSTVTGTATDAAGNVFVTGSFSGQVMFGSTVLNSSGGTDVFVAKWVPSTGTWAWAQSGGGSSDDNANGIAVSGSSVYVVGTMNDFSYYYSSYSSSPPSYPAVRFGNISLWGSATSYYSGYTHSSFSGTYYQYGNMVLLRYTDGGSTATLDWAQGSSTMEEANGIAVNGNAIYVIGSNVLAYTSTSEHCQAFRGCHTDYSYGGQSNIVLQRYNDAGTGVSLAWTQTAGGKGSDRGYDVAVSGSYAYITGTTYNNSANGSSVLFGTTAVAGSSASYSNDMMVARYTDAGVFSWARTGGGTGQDMGHGIAVSGANVYVTGYIYNTAADAHAVRFGGTAVAGASTTASNDVLLARYTDAGAFGWARAGGGSGADIGKRVVASSAAAYVTGYIHNTAADAHAVRFGGTAVAGASTTASNDILVARYASNGTFSWARSGGGAGADEGGGITVSGTNVYAGAFAASTSASFGAATGSPLNGGTGTNRAVVSRLTDGTTSGSWQQIQGVNHGGVSSITATALNASGEVFVAGSFTGEVTFGNTTLGSVGGNDLFVAKWVPSTGTWAWAVAGGGTGHDYGSGIAVSGNAVYVTGSVNNSSADAQAVRLGTSAVAGASTTTSDDLLLARYTDNGSSATFNWARTGGGTGSDKGAGVAANGNAVYVTGVVNNNIADANAVRFSGTTVAGASATASNDVLVARYNDNATSAALAWARTGGGIQEDIGAGIAVSGTAVYVTGSVTNNLADANAVRFGGTTVAGASASSSPDVLVARYNDNATSAALAWAQTGGGTSTDAAAGIAVAGNAVYITGSFINNAADAQAVRFGGTAVAGAGANASYDLLLVRYTDNTTSSSVEWVQTGGSDSQDQGTGVAVSGNSVYVVGSVSAGQAPVVFSGTEVFGVNKYSSDVVVARYTDNTNAAVFDWATTGGGTNRDTGAGIAVSNPYVFVGGTAMPTAKFGDHIITSPVGSNINFIGMLDVSKPHIGWVAPASATAGTTVTLSNYLLGGAANLVVNGVSTSITSNTDKSISFVLPAGVGPANLITATTAAGPVSTTAFTALLNPVSYSPAVNSLAVPTLSSSIALTYSEPVTATSGDGVRVFSMQAGGRKAGTVSVSGSLVSFAGSGSQAPFAYKPGEVISVSVPAALQNSGGLAASKRVYQFTTAVGGTGGGNFQTPTANAEPAAGAGPVGVVTADVDGDGDLDLLAVNATTNAVALRINDGNGVFTSPATGASIGVGYNPNALTTGDIDGDGDLDLLVANTSGNNVSVRLNNGSGIFSVPPVGSEVYVGATPRSIALGDIDADGDLDLLTANSNSNTVSIRLNNGTGGFTSPATDSEINVNQNPQALTLGDVDGDGDLDLLTAASSYYDNTVRVSLNNGSGSFSYHQAVYTGSNPNALTLGDVDADGDLDLLTANYYSNSVSVRLNNGSGLFLNPSTNAELAVGVNPRQVALSDIDGDGDLDLLTANYSDNTISVRINNGQGSFTAPAVSASVSVGANPQGLALSDLDGDGDLDILAACTAANAVSVRLNEPAPMTITALSTSAELPGMPITITGTGFKAGCGVTIGGVSALNVVVNSTTSLTATVPASAAVGTNQVTVTLGAATSISPTSLTVLALYNGATTTCPATMPYTATGDGKWHYLLADNGQVIAALQDTRASLGTITVNYQVTGTANPVRQDGRGRKYLDRNIHITASGGAFPGHTVNLRFFGLTDELTRLQAADATVSYASLHATQYSGANEDCVLENNDFAAGEFRTLAAVASTPGSGVPWFVAQVAVQDHFSEFFLTGSVSPLPVELTAFTASKRNQAVVLAWHTATEKNNDRFEVERSIDGRTFERIGTVAGQGTKAGPTEYTYVDSRYPSLATMLYYRLRQVDQNGPFTLSLVRTVQLEKTASLQLYPNPARTTVTVAGVQANGSVEVFDALGRVVASAKAEASGRAVIQLPANLPAGVYFVRSNGLTSRLKVE